MIEEYYPVKKSIWPGNHHRRKQEPANETPLLENNSFESQRAFKRNLTVEVYRQRVAAVVEESKACTFQTGDHVWPVKPTDVKLYGECIVSAVCRHFDDYGSVAWNDPPFILSLISIADKNKTVQCTRGWATKVKPETIVESC